VCGVWCVCVCVCVCVILLLSSSPPLSSPLSFLLFYVCLNNMLSHHRVLKHPESCILTASVWDGNKAAKDKLLGLVEVPVSELMVEPPLEEWYSLVNYSGAKVIAGDIHLTLNYFAERKSLKCTGIFFFLVIFVTTFVIINIYIVFLG